MPFVVDIPNISEEDWIYVRSFPTRAEAIAYVKEFFGGDDEGRVQLISEVDNDD